MRSAPARLKDHNKAKPFWQRALVMVSRTHSLTQTHALFLEWHSLSPFRQRLLGQGVMRAEGDTVVFVRDHLFRSLGEVKRQVV